MKPTLLHPQPIIAIPVDPFTGNSKLLCPTCGFNYVHLARVDVEQGHARVEASRDQYRVQPTDRHQHHRGSAAKLAFWCEHGHWFEYEFSFHKGNLFVDLCSAELDDLQFLPELWRN